MKVFTAVLAALALAVAVNAQQPTITGNPTVPVIVPGTNFNSTTTFSTPNGACNVTQLVSAQQAMLACPYPLAIAAKNPCLVVAPFNAWTSYAFAPQTGSFQIIFTYTPTSAAQDAVIGFGSTAATAATQYAPLALSIRFNDGNGTEVSGTPTIDVRNGGGYAAVTNVPYAVGQTYTFNVQGNAAAQTYSVTVTPAGGTASTLATNYAYRTGATATTPIAVMTVIVDEGAATGGGSVCTLTVGAWTPAPTQHKVALSWNPSAVDSTHPAPQGYLVWRATKSGGPYTALNSTSQLVINPPAPPAAAFTDGTVANATNYFYVVTGYNYSSVPPSSGNSNEASAVIPAS